MQDENGNHPILFYFIFIFFLKLFSRRLVSAVPLVAITGLTNSGCLDSRFLACMRKARQVSITWFQVLLLAVSAIVLIRHVWLQSLFGIPRMFHVTLFADTAHFPALLSSHFFRAASKMWPPQRPSNISPARNMRQAKDKRGPTSAAASSFLSIWNYFFPLCFTSGLAAHQLVVIKRGVVKHLKRWSTVT